MRMASEVHYWLDRNLIFYFFKINLSLKFTNQMTVLIATYLVQNNLTTLWAIVPFYTGYLSGLTLIGISHISGVLNQFGSAASRAFHGHSP
jgi:hypothetical protein